METKHSTATSSKREHERAVAGSDHSLSLHQPLSLSPAVAASPLSPCRLLSPSVAASPCRRVTRCHSLSLYHYVATSPAVAIFPLFDLRTGCARET